MAEERRQGLAVRVWVGPGAAFLLLLVFPFHFECFFNFCFYLLNGFVFLLFLFFLILFFFLFGFFVVAGNGPFIMGLGLALPPSFSDCGLALPFAVWRLAVPSRGGCGPFLLGVGVGSLVGRERKRRDKKKERE